VFRVTIPGVKTIEVSGGGGSRMEPFPQVRTRFNNMLDFVAAMDPRHALHYYRTLRYNSWIAEGTWMGRG
jgi:hypothetical protein